MMFVVERAWALTSRPPASCLLGVGLHRCLVARPARRPRVTTSASLAQPPRVVAEAIARRGGQPVDGDVVLGPGVVSVALHVAPYPAGDAQHIPRRPTAANRRCFVFTRIRCERPSSIRVSSWLLTPCSLSDDRSWPGRSPRLSPAPQCKPCWRLWRETKVRNAKLIGLNEISRSSSLCSWPAYAPRSSASRTLAIFAPPITGPRPSTSEAKAARNAACRLRLNSCRSSRRTSIAAPSGFQVVLSAKQATAPRPCRDGPRDHRYSSGVTANESPAEHCNHESSGPSSVLAPKRNPSQVPSFTGFGIPTRLNWPAPTSAYTRS